MFTFLLLNVHSYQTGTFLSVLNHEDTKSSTSSILADGMHNTDLSLESLSSQLSSSLQSIGLKLDNSLKTTSSSILALLDSEIEEKQSALSSINSEIHYLLRNSKSIYEKCSGFRTCEACSYNPLCVWCDIEQLCVGGDADGPFHSECSYFSYQGCYVNGCRGHSKCSSCVQSQTCGWCAGESSCMESIDSCETLPYIHFNVPGSVCPENKVVYPEVYINANPTGSTDDSDEATQRRIIELRDQASKAIQEIQQLEYAKAKLIEEVEKNLEILVPDIQVKDLNSNIVNKVIKTEKIEAEELKENLLNQKEKFEELTQSPNI